MTPLQKAAWNKAIRNSVDALLHKGGYNKESSARHQLAMMNFDVESEQAQAVKPFEIEFPDYHGQAMRYGLEDRNITDRYEAMRYGWDQALERVEDCLPEKLYTHPAPPAQSVKPVATVQCINGVTIGYLDVMQPVGTKLYLHPAPTPAEAQQVAVLEKREPLNRVDILNMHALRCWPRTMFADKSYGIALDTVTVVDFVRIIEAHHGIGAKP